MPLRWTSSQSLTIETFLDAYSYSAHSVLGGGTSTPKQSKEFSASRAALALQDGLFVHQRSFARILEAEMGTDHGVGLIIPIDYFCNINNRDVDNSTIALMRGKTPVRVIEERSNTYFMLRFNSDLRQRGWPEDRQLIQYYRLDNESIQRIRAIAGSLFRFASTPSDVQQLGHVGRSIQESLLSELDAAFAPNHSPATHPVSFNRYRKLLDDIDEYIQSSPISPLYSGRLAETVGVSTRTLQTATQAVHGMSLHRYLTVRRAWAVRKQLLSGIPGLTVKAAAHANGFWHMGEFSRTYKSLFGESPSETLARVRA